MGPMLEDLELDLRNTIEGIYFQKTKEIINGMRVTDAEIKSRQKVEFILPNNNKSKNEKKKKKQIEHEKQFNVVLIYRKWQIWDKRQHKLVINCFL